jgi:hypothetical protein
MMRIGFRANFMWILPVAQVVAWAKAVERARRRVASRSLRSGERQDRGTGAGPRRRESQPDMRLPLLLLLSLFSAGVAHGTVERVPIESNVELKPGEARTITVEATRPMEIGWSAAQAQPCTGNCVEATDVTGGVNYTIATRLGASMTYTPVSGKITIRYKNVSSAPVTIDVYQVQRTCEAEACAFLHAGQKGRWLVFKVDEFTSIATSTDGSYSVISGVTVAGRPFRFKAVWWTDDRKNLLIRCAPFVKRYLDTHTPKERYSPYIISGQAVGEGDSIVLRSIDTCAPKAPNFGVPEKNVFR